MYRWLKERKYRLQVSEDIRVLAAYIDDGRNKYIGTMREYSWT